jgi:tungstate transport system substrate-binding protein
VLGATTTIEDTGLLTELQTEFSKDHPRIKIRTVTGGTGEVHRLARGGDVDLTMTHDPAAESTLVAKGIGLYRRELMYNDFVIAGPAADSARVRGLRDAAEALRRIAGARAPFLSRGDDSGTHRKELFLWRQAGLDAPGRKPAWYREAGVGMGEALRIANVRHAYLLTERGTYLTMKPLLQLDVLVEGDPRLLNRYGIVRLKSARNAEAADSFAVWLKSPRGAYVIGRFGRQKYGQSLFTPAQ